MAEVKELDPRKIEDLFHAFENADFAELEENTIPTGEYTGTDGNSVTVEDATK